jgi:serine/threonine-protein kinase
MTPAAAGMPQPLSNKRRNPLVAVCSGSSGSLGKFADGFTDHTTRIRLSSLPRCSPSSVDLRQIQEVIHGSLPLAPGCELGPFRLVEVLGHGAQGDVWKARRLAANEELVALKVLKPSLARHPARMAQFRHEAERGLRLSGPSLLTAWELAESDGYLFMTMPYVEGTALRDVIKWRRAFLAGEDGVSRHPFVSLDESGYLFAMVGVLAEAAMALARAHERHIVHRDVKPANILLDNHWVGHVYLCDFGLGRDLEVATTEQMRDGSGTPMYMAPERLLLFAADEIKCDIYSMGVTLCEALTLERPFRVPEHLGVSGLAPFLARAEPRRPCLLDPDFPEELEAIIMRAMARDPRQRHDSARELAGDLARFAEGAPVPVPPSRAPAESRLRLNGPHTFSRRDVADRSDEDPPVFDPGFCRSPRIADSIIEGFPVD